MNSQTKKILVVGSLVIALLLFVPTNSNATESTIINFEVGAGGSPYLTAIPDAKGYWQIGFGSTWNYDANRWVQPGDTITESQAYQWLRNEIHEKEILIDNLVTVPINANQKRALVSLAYNIGSTKFSGSTLLRLLNSGADLQTVADQFDVWRMANGSVSPGLVQRRAMEKQIFLS